MTKEYNEKEYDSYLAVQDKLNIATEKLDTTIVNYSYISIGFILLISYTNLLENMNTNILFIICTFIFSLLTNLFCTYYGISEGKKYLRAYFSQFTNHKPSLVIKLLNKLYFWCFIVGWLQIILLLIYKH